VFFSQWSAMLDEDAHSVIRASADWALQCADADVVLTCYVEPDGPQMIGDLANLRRSVIEAELAGLGVERARMKRATSDMTGVPGIGAESGRIDIIVKSD
jgi:hypothetical protein